MNAVSWSAATSHAISPDASGATADPWRSGRSAEAPSLSCSGNRRGRVTSRNRKATAEARRSAEERQRKLPRGRRGLGPLTLCTATAEIARRLRSTFSGGSIATQRRRVRGETPSRMVEHHARQARNGLPTSASLRDLRVSALNSTRRGKRASRSFAALPRCALRVTAVATASRLSWGSAALCWLADGRLAGCGQGRSLADRNGGSQPSGNQRTFPSALRSGWWGRHPLSSVSAAHTFYRPQYPGGGDAGTSRAHCDGTITEAPAVDRNAAFTRQPGRTSMLLQPKGCVPVVPSRCAIPAGPDLRIH